MSEYDEQWNDDEIVPLGELRPSREHFGPVPAQGKGKSARQPGATPGRRSQAKALGTGSGRPARPVKAGSAQRALPAAQSNPDGAAERPQPRPLPSRSGEVAGRALPARQRQAAPSSRNEQKSLERSPATRRPATARRPRDEQFADRLAAADQRHPIVQPLTGWRQALRKASGGAIDLGMSAGQRAEAELRTKIRRPVDNGTIAVFSRKGGVGKTTISAYLGLTLASERGGRIVVLDGDAEAGSLGWLLAPRAPSTLAALAAADPIPNDYGQLRRYTAVTPEGLEVIVGEPAEMGPISTTGLEAVADQLARHYDLSIFDTGAGVTRAAGRVLVNNARVLLLVMSPSVDSVRAAERTLAWLDERPGEAVRPGAQVVAVINGIPPNVKNSHVERIESHFADRCHAVVRLPWDQHLAAGSTSVSLDRLAKPTRQAFLELAATTVTALARPARRPQTAGARRAS